MEMYQKIGNYLRKILHSLDKENRISSPFDSKRIPGISIENYITRSYTFSSASDNSHITALILLKRLLITQRLCPDIRNIHRLYIISLRIASKLMDDLHLSNYNYALVAGLSLYEFNYLEHEFLNDINWNLHVSEECFNEMVLYIEVGQ